MQEKKTVKTYKDLNVFEQSYRLAMEIFEMTQKFPKEEIYSLTDQIRRSSRSVPANIAEAWMKRLYQKMFISKVIDSMGEAGETEVWLDVAKDCQYLNSEEYKRLFDSYQEVNRMLSGMVDKADRFCINHD